MASRNKNIRIFLVDDQPVVRQALKFTIRRERDLTVCGEAEDRETALKEITTIKPDMAIVGLRLKNSDGLELVKDICSRCPEVLTLVFSMRDESLHAERAIRAGASGYISKQEPTPNIMRAVRRILGGEIYWSEKVAAQVASRTVCPTRCKTGLAVALLSRRELQVFEMIGTGETKARIAQSLHIDASTVETYRTRIKEKLNLKDATELLQKAIHWTVMMAGC